MTLRLGILLVRSVSRRIPLVVVGYSERQALVIHGTNDHKGVPRY
jgi:hypothetical protein